MWLAVIDGDPGPHEEVRQGGWRGVDEDKFPIFASAITGRDYSVVTSLAPRSTAEKKTMGDALQEGPAGRPDAAARPGAAHHLADPQDQRLTRSLDESLHTKQGPVRTFMILARYCMRTVFYEQAEDIRRRGSLCWPPNAVRFSPPGSASCASSSSWRPLSCARREAHARLPGARHGLWVEGGTSGASRVPKHLPHLPQTTC